MKYIKLFLAVLPAILTVIFINFLSPVKSAIAAPLQQTTISCTTVTAATYNAVSYVGEVTYQGSTGYGESALGLPDSNPASLNAYYNNTWSVCALYSFAGTMSGTITLDIPYTDDYGGDEKVREGLMAHASSGQMASGLMDGLDGWYVVHDHVWNGWWLGQMGTIGLCAWQGDVLSLYHADYFDAITATLTGEFCTSTITETCATVEDYHFSGVISDSWQLSSGAAISDSVLTLPELDYARQNLTLQANKTYNAVISVTNLNESDAILTLSLGGTDQNLTITGTGIYTTVLHTPASLAGPILYTIKNDPPEEYLPIFDPIIEIGWTCLYLGDDQQDCLAPVNGEFNSANYWLWYRGSSWKTPAKYAGLSYLDKGAIFSTEAYSMPTLNSGEYLLMSFDARSEGSDDSGSGVCSKVDSLSTVITNSFAVYPQFYTYEIDLRALSGQNDVSISFANPGNGVTQNSIVDNICVFISDRPANLPTPTDETAYNPIDLGINFTSCADTDAVWTSFGINMAYYRQVYLTGVSLWDTSNWVSWIVSAIFVTLSAWSCMFVASFVAIVKLIEYALNTFLNWFNWFLQSVENIINWLIISLPIVWSIFIAYFFNLNGLRFLLNLLIAAWNEFFNATWGVVEWLINSLLIDPWNNIIIPFIWSFFSWIYLFGYLIDFITNTWNLLVTLFWLIMENFFGLLLLPVDFFWAFYYGISEPSFAEPFSCSGANFWCLFFAGVELINLTVSHSVIYPLFIGGIIITTVVVAWVNIKELFSVNIK